MNERRRLADPWPERPRPGELQLVDVARVDLIERAESPAVHGAAPVDPVSGVRVLEHRVGHRFERSVLRGERKILERECREERPQGQSPPRPAAERAATAHTTPHRELL